MKNKIISFILSLVFFAGFLPIAVSTEAFAEEYINLQGCFSAQNTGINAYVVPKEYAGASVEIADLTDVSLYHTSSLLDSFGKYNIQIPKEYAGENYVYITCQNQSTLQVLENYKTHGISEIKISENDITVSGLAESETNHVALFVLKSGKTYTDFANGDLTAIKSMNSALIENGGYTAVINDCIAEEGDMLLVSFGAEFIISEITDFSASIDLYVSGSGNDENIGDKLSPLKTLDKARNLVQSINKEVTRVNVYINEGEYQVPNFTLGKKDGGSKEYPVTYQGIGNERPVFKNTKKIDTAYFEGLSSAEKNLIREDAKSKVQKVNLSTLGFTAGDFNLDSKSGQEIYFNGVKQELAGWPNNGYTLIDDILVPQTETQNLVFAFYNKELMRWKDAKYPIIEGYMGVEYEKQRVSVGEINPDEFSISYADYAYYGGKEGYRFRITNLLEELDMPGEYYLDRDTLVLYYYPYESFKQGDTMEVLLPSTSVFTMDNVSNVKLSGISIAQNDADGITLKDCSNITIEDCYIGKLGGKGIVGSGTDINISSNTIANVGSVGIDFERGGDRSKLIENNVKIQNNHIYLTGSTGIRVRTNTVGTNIINNVIHKTGHYPVWFGGNKNYIAYNEIYNSNRELGDTLAVYSGRNLSEYGNEISYNYIHSVGSLDERYYGSGGIGSGDDWESGTIIKNNIVFMDSKHNTSAIATHSRDNTIQYNIAVGAAKGMALADRYVWGGSLFEQTGAAETVLKSLTSSDGLAAGYAETDIWKKEYPQISTIYQDLLDNDGRFITRDNVITDNVLVDAPLKYYNTHPVCDHSEMFKKYSTIENNLETDSYDIFVDHENHDFRITNEAMRANKLNPNIINESNFNMDSIGIQGEIDTFDKDFILTYPQNNTVLNSESEMILKWQDTGFADNFTYQVATDENFDNIVSEDTVYVNYAKIDVKRNQTYYWRVIANNTSKEFGTTWQNLGGNYSFSVVDKPVTVNNVRIKDSENSQSADIYFTNNEEQDLECMVIMADYEDDGRLKGINTFYDTIASNEVSKLHSYNIENLMLKNYSVFVWNKDYKPLSKSYIKNILGEVEANVVTLTTKSPEYSEVIGIWSDGSLENQRIGSVQNGKVSASFEYFVDSPGYYNVYYKVNTLTEGAENANVFVTNGGGNVSQESETINKTVNFKTQNGLVYLGKIIAINTGGYGYLRVGVTADSGSISVSEIVLEETIE